MINAAFRLANPAVQKVVGRVDVVGPADARFPGHICPPLLHSHVKLSFLYGGNCMQAMSDKE